MILQSLLVFNEDCKWCFSIDNGLVNLFFLYSIIIFHFMIHIVLVRWCNFSLAWANIWNSYTAECYFRINVTFTAVIKMPERNSKNKIEWNKEPDGLRDMVYYNNFVSKSAQYAWITNSTSFWFVSINVI